MENKADPRLTCPGQVSLVEGASLEGAGVIQIKMLIRLFGKYLLF